MTGRSTALVVTNDFHSAVPTGRRLLTALRRARAQGALLVDGGDFFGGNAFHAFSRGRTEETLLADLYDAVVPGNHDLADLMRLTDPGGFPPVVCANVTPPASYRGRWVRGLLLPTRKRQPRVGVVGYLGRQAFDAAPTGESAGFVFTEPTAALIAAERDRLYAAGAEVVVGVSHSGFARDVADQQQDWPLRLVAGGHCHTPSYHWAQDGRQVVKAPEEGSGLLRLDLDSSGAGRVTVETFPSEPESGLEDELEDTLAAYRAWGDELVGVLPAPLERREDVAALLADAASTVVGAEAFVLNLGALRAGLPARVTRRALFDCAPFDNGLVTLTAPHQIQQVLERARALDEELVTPGAAPVAPCSAATTQYLADRLSLAAAPTPHTLHSTLTRLFRESR